jgi:hypothetical protein
MRKVSLSAKERKKITYNFNPEDGGRMFLRNVGVHRQQVSPTVLYAMEYLR